MPRIGFAEEGDTAFQRLLGHNPSILYAWNALEDAFHFHGRLDGRLREQVRRTLALGNGCLCCQAFGPPDPEHSDPKEGMAVAFALLMQQGASEIGDDQFDVFANTSPGKR